nr:pyruvate, phosphate dikinase regulatory protein, chloroplastic [Tanacetum cinerariifolium]
MLQKQKDPMMSEKKVNTKPVDYAALNQLSQDFKTRFVPQTELSAEQVFWSQNSVHSEEPNLSTRPTIVEVPKELPKVSMVNSSLKKLKFHLASFDVEKALVITSLKDTLIKLKGKAVVDEAITLHPVDLELIRIDVAPLALKLQNNKTAHYDYLKHTQEKTATLREIVENERLLNPFNTSLNYASQSQEKDTVIMKLKERIKSLSGNLKEEKIKKELDEIETINIELDHMVTKLVTKNEHLKQTYKQLYDSIKSSRVRSKEQSLKDTLSKLKGKAVVDEVVTLYPIDPELLRIDVIPLAQKLRNNRTAHYDYLKHTQEETSTLREIVENERLLNPLNTSLDYA